MWNTRKCRIYKKETFEIQCHLYSAQDLQFTYSSHFSKFEKETKLIRKRGLFTGEAENQTKKRKEFNHLLYGSNKYLHMAISVNIKYGTNSSQLIAS